MNLLRKCIAVALAATLTAPAALADGAAQPFTLVARASIQTSATVGATAAEIVAYDAKTQRAFAINSQENELVVIDLKPLRSGGAPVVGAKLSFAAHGAGLNSVAVHDGLVAVAVEAAPKTKPGKVVVFRADAATLDAAVAFEVGALPDMVTFSRDGEYLLVANEGEPNSYGFADSVNPEGSVSIINLERGLRRATVQTASFAGFNGQLDALKARGVRIYGPGATVAQDLEPEYITTRGRTAWVTLQEANAIAIIDIPTAMVTDIVPLGLKDHRLPGNTLDASDRDSPTGTAAINLRNWPVYGMYQPDAIASFRARDGQTYLVTANEGDSRSAGDFPGFEEESRVGASGYRLDPDSFTAAEITALKANAALGRLTVTTRTGDTDGDGLINQIQVFGGRSFSIRSASGDLVWDSGDEFERFLAAEYPAFFNADHATPAAFDNRSDNKGPEPEGVAVGKIRGRQYAFIGLERAGGVMAYDVTDPAAPTFVAYANNREADRGAEGVTFVPADDSPTERPLVLVGNEVSRTVTVFEVISAGRGDDHEDGDDRDHD